ncbi:MAG: epoxide hydrolase N-terminal domain-containing protein, partial [Chloroflexi bacterium]|nr:epoxide hydrolase N-terminal domain-containing protein [Chloroflexota bacterium]
MNSQPYTIHVAEDILEDLRERLGRTRWPDMVDGAGWDYGANLDYIRELAEYWRTGFDWRAQEARLNLLPNYRAEVGGMGIHFIHVRGNGPRPLPIVLTHG